MTRIEDTRRRIATIQYRRRLAVIRRQLIEARSTAGWSL